MELVNSTDEKMRFAMRMLGSGNVGWIGMQESEVMGVKLVIAS